MRSVLEWTTDFFAQRGVASARLDAEILLAHALGRDRLALYLRYEETVPNAVLRAYRGLIQRRVRHEPIAYITGRREFYSISFSVDPSVLIPRPETEHLVEHVLRRVQHLPGQSTGPGPLRILEIGTGSGNVSILLAKQLPQAHIVSMDVSLPAISVAVKNRKEHPDCSERIRFFQGDLFDALHPQRARFHVIVSNPPYVATDAWGNLAPEVRDFEPRVALDGGARGTEILYRIVHGAPDHLLPGGALIVEIGHDQGEAVPGMAQHTGRYGEISVLDDYAGKPRVLVAIT